MEKINRLIFPFLLTAIVLTAGCEMFARHSDPIAGWQKDYGSVDQLIANDCQNYIQKLSPNEQKFMAYTESFEDGTGQHAIKITIGLNGTDWEHVLIYDKDNKRIKTIKYISGHSRS